ncbi:hypothetical protein SDC9_41890 [bioreactor metagenome]|uniref:ABC-three component systems C-terminal domain-containing protein n=1 Tax=bioreactor metagenome TaxID=1076179 RepID=A0A644VWH7_9ZZZZ|nr:ABC-three component system protein [Desulfitobacterium hafniense]MEA5024110.1 ABC-three component system protein [Desulfitobacterium hafniense]
MKDLKSILEADTYLQPRGKPTESELRLFLREVDFYCPLCGKELQSRKQKKLAEKRFQIAHIYPNSPTAEQYDVLKGLERLGENSESFENKIALCRDCHGTQDFHTTIEEYLKLMEIKKTCLRQTALHDATSTLGLENEIETVIEKICELKESDISEINYKAVIIANKFVSDEMLLKSKITGYVMTYYTYIRDLFKNMERTTAFNLDILSGQIRACFIKMDSSGANKHEIFENMVNWVNNETQNTSKLACEAIISFFVQHCEVFYEITE